MPAVGLVAALPWLVPAVAGAATSIGTTAYASRQSNNAASRARARELAAAKIDQEASDRAFQLGKEQLDYDRWLTKATGQARKPYMDMVAGMGGGADYSPAPYASAEPFVAPTREAAMNEEGYKMVAEEGDRALTDAPGARSTALGGGTLQALQGRGAAMATGQYDKVYDRAFNSYAMREGQRGQAWDRTTGAGFQAAGLRGQGSSARARGLLSIAQLAGAGQYPGYVTPPGAPHGPTGPLGGGFAPPAPTAPWLPTGITHGPGGAY